MTKILSQISIPQRSRTKMRAKIINILAVVSALLFVMVFLFTKFYHFSKPATDFDVAVRVLNFFCYGICPVPFIIAALLKIELNRKFYPLFVTFLYCLIFLAVYNISYLGISDSRYREALQSDIFNVLCSLSIVLVYLLSYLFFYECNKEE